ncbi:hypothetical protein SAMN05446935_7707 [Burkholderia sp. YR290]|nr:hypothetical protein SAMN05446935_7707 [Burkholderia sp. YR290]
MAVPMDFVLLASLLTESPKLCSDGQAGQPLPGLQPLTYPSDYV